MNARCVVFDIDHTLYLERDYVRSGFDAAGKFVAGALGIDRFSAAAWSQFEVGARGRLFDVALEECDVTPSPELVTQLVGVHRRHGPAIVMAADAVACLERTGATATVAFLTTGPIDSQRAKADALDVRRYGDVVVFTGELSARFGKPHMRGFQDIERFTGCTGAR